MPIRSATRLEVLHLQVRGCMNMEIVAQLFPSKGTVCNCDSDHTQTAVIALRHGLDYAFDGNQRLMSRRFRKNTAIITVIPMI